MNLSELLSDISKNSCFRGIVEPLPVILSGLKRLQALGYMFFPSSELQIQLDRFRNTSVSTDINSGATFSLKDDFLIITNPHLLACAMNEILKNSHLHRFGMLSLSDFSQIWENSLQLAPSLHPRLLRILINLDLIFLVPCSTRSSSNENGTCIMYSVPAVLPIERSHLAVDWFDKNEDEKHLDSSMQQQPTTYQTFYFERWFLLPKMQFGLLGRLIDRKSVV